MRERSWGVRVARTLIQSERHPGEDDLTLYRRLIDETVHNVVVVEDRIEKERQELEDLVHLVQGQLELEGELAQQRIGAANVMLDAEKARRRLDREARNAETRARRAVEGGNRAGIISRHVVVDPGAWTFLAKEARRRNTTLMALAGQTLAAEVIAVTAGSASGLPSSRRRRGAGERAVRPSAKVVRLALGLDDWHELRGLSGANHTTAARYAGEVMEAAAHALGWRAV